MNSSLKVTFFNRHEQTITLTFDHFGVVCVIYQILHMPLLVSIIGAVTICIQKLWLGESAIVHKAHMLRDDSYFHDVVNVCMSCDGNRLMGLVTTINSIYKNSKYPVKFHILVTSAAYQFLL